MSTGLPLPAKTVRRLELWDSYRSYQYLEAGEDFRAFELAPALGRVPGSALEWREEVEARARDFEERHPVVSAHDHLSLRPANPGTSPTTAARAGSRFPTRASPTRGWTCSSTAARPR
ncbi:hypothetical protein GCM10017744_017640 [Streptomyces antimycoticus]